MAVGVILRTLHLFRAHRILSRLTLFLPPKEWLRNNSTVLFNCSGTFMKQVGGLLRNRFKIFTWSQCTIAHGDVRYCSSQWSLILKPRKWGGRFDNGQIWMSKRELACSEQSRQARYDTQPARFAKRLHISGPIAYSNPYNTQSPWSTWFEVPDNLREDAKRGFVRFWLETPIYP